MKYGAFLKRKTLTNGTTRRSATALSPASSLFKSVCLYDWWLIKPQEGEEGLAVAGFLYREGLSGRAFKSAAISKRHDATTLETVDGFTILLVGFINKDLTLQNGFSSEVCDKSDCNCELASHFELYWFAAFSNLGFHSYKWEEYTVKGSNKVLRSHDNGLAEHTFKKRSINKSKDPRPEDSDPRMHSHQGSDCHILSRKAMEDLFECVRDSEQNGSLSFSNGKNINISDGTMMLPDGTHLNSSDTCFLRDGRGLALEKKAIDTEALEKKFQFESYEEHPGSRKPGRVERHPGSDHVIVPTKRKDTNVAEGSFTLGKVNCNSATMTDSVESHTTLEAGGIPSAISDKPTGIRRITRSMTREKKDRPSRPWI